MSSIDFGDVARQARHMQDMIERLKVDTVKLACLEQGEGYVEARVTCFDCKRTEDCFHWLEASSDNIERPIFCPNLSLFEWCKRD